MKPTIEYKNTLFKHKLYQLIPLNALFPRTFLLFVEEEILDPLEIWSQAI